LKSVHHRFEPVLSAECEFVFTDIQSLYIWGVLGAYRFSKLSTFL